jgi:hypothetical protein
VLWAKYWLIVENCHFRPLAKQKSVDVSEQKLAQLITSLGTPIGSKVHQDQAEGSRFPIFCEVVDYLSFFVLYALSKPQPREFSRCTLYADRCAFNAGCAVWNFI